MSRETTIIYNNITIYNVLTDSIEQDVVPEGTGVNPIYVRVTVSCTGIIRPYAAGQPNTIGLELLDPNLAIGYNQIIDQLMQPGRAFQMYIGGTSIFDVVPGHVRPGLPNPNAGDTLPIRRTDVNHGPIPSVRVLMITSAYTMRVQFKVVMHLPYTDQDGQKIGGAISLRFWIEEDIDCADWTTERTYRGVFRVRHLGHNNLTEIRQNFIFPPLVEGFQRKHISLSQKSNGLELDFTIRDKEVWAVPPAPATSWEGSQIIFSPEPGGAMLLSEVSVRLRADKNQPKLGLVQTAINILYTKLHKLDDLAFNSSFVTAFRIQDNFASNEVEAGATINLVPARTVLYNIPKGNFGRSLDVGFDDYPGEFPAYNKERAAIVFPTACIKGLFLAALQDPLHITGFPSDNENSRQITYAALQCQHVVDQASQFTENQDKLSSSHKSSAFNMYKMQSETDKNWGTIQLPLGKSSSGNDSAAILHIHKPTAQLRVNVEAERIGEWPTLPTPQEYAKLGTTYTPMRSPMKPSAPILSADHMKSMYHVSMQLHFGQPREGNGIPAGLMPYRINNTSITDGGPDVYVLPASYFSDKVLFA